MRVRFGYVAISLALKDASPNKTITVTNLMKLAEEDRLTKLSQLARQNLHNQLRLLKHNKGSGIKVYRFTSNLIPLATHDIARRWAYDREFAAEFREIGDYVKKGGFRVSFHPDHFVNLNSPKEEILCSSLHILRHHFIQSHAMGLSDKMKFNIHIGGAYSDKEAALERFIERWGDLDAVLQGRITVENDDKTFTVQETLYVCEKLGIPMVLDVLHHRCNPGADADGATHSLEPLLPAILNTWRGTGLPPKVHISSPKGTSSPAELRSHADYIRVEDVVPFLKMAARFTDELDVMLEAKAKDMALFRLMDDLSRQSDLTVTGPASVEV